MGNNTALKKMIGKLPKNWESMSPEDKIRTVLKKGQYQERSVFAPMGAEIFS